MIVNLSVNPFLLIHIQVCKSVQVFIRKTQNGEYLYNILYKQMFYILLPPYRGSVRLTNID